MKNNLSNPIRRTEREREREEEIYIKFYTFKYSTLSIFQNLKNTYSYLVHGNVILQVLRISTTLKAKKKKKILFIKDSWQEELIINSDKVP